MVKGKDRKRANGSGGLRPYRLSDGSVRWEIYFNEPGASGEPKRRFKKGYLDQSEALNALQSIQVHLREGTHQRRVKDSFGDYAEAYLAGLRVKPTTAAVYKRHFRVHIEPAIGQMKLAAVTKNELNKLYRTMEKSGRRDMSNLGKPSSPATIRHVHAMLRQILQSAVDDGLLLTNPAMKSSPPSLGEARPPEMEVWDQSQAIAFLNWSKHRGDYLYVAWRLLLGTGMRRGELVALRWRDIDLDAKRITVARSYYYIKQSGQSPQKGFGTPKSGKLRVIDIDTGLADLLADSREAQRTQGVVSRDDLVISNRKGEPLNPERLSEQFRARVITARKEMDLPILHLHSLRHTHATLLLVGGIHIKVVSERLGHASILITLTTYSHVSPTLQREAATAIGGMLSSP